jgi:hypothetical protein
MTDIASPHFSISFHFPLGRLRSGVTSIKLETGPWLKIDLDLYDGCAVIYLGNTVFGFLSFRKPIFKIRLLTKVEPHFGQFWCIVTLFRINTYKSVTKQTTLNIFRMNTYEKHMGVGCYC